MASDKALSSEVISAFVRALYRHLRAKAERELGLASTSDAQPGSITFLQRSASAVNLHPHLHLPVLDDEPLLAARYATSLRSCDSVGGRAGLPSLRLVGEPPATSPSRRGVAVHHEGFSIHVGDQIYGRDRNRLERLIRYVARPPLANDRLRIAPARAPPQQAFDL